MRTHRIVTSGALLALGLMGCDQAGPEDPGAGEGQAPTRPAGMAEAQNVLRLQVAPDHTIDFYRFKDGSAAYRETGSVKTSLPRLTKEIVHGLNPMEVFHALAPDKPLPAVLEKAFIGGTSEGETSLIEQTSAALPREPVVVALSQPLTQGGLNSTGLSGCPAWWYFQGIGISCASGQTWPPDPSTQRWCLMNAAWAFVEQPAMMGSSNLCVDSGTSRYYMEFDSEYREADVPAGNWSTFWIPIRETCSWWQGCRRVKNRHMKFGFQPGGVAHFQGDFDL